MTEPITIYPKDDRIYVEFAYDEALVARVRAIPGAVWKKEERAWTFHPTAIDHLAGAFPRALFMGGLERKVREILSGVMLPHVMDAPQPEGLAFELRPFQRAGVAALAKTGSALLADEMGLGKTVEALALVHVTKPKRVLVICPAAVKLTWVEHAWRVLGVRALVVNDKKALRYFLERGGIAVTNYDRIHRSGMALEIEDGAIDLLVLDEAHYIKNRQALRSRAALAIAEASMVVLAMTGTPVMNRPIELFNILVATRKLRPSDFWKFVLRYCGAHKTQFGWDMNGASNLDELHAMIRPYTIRRMKADVLKELPPKQYTNWKIECSGKEYKAANKEARNAYLAGGVKAVTPHLMTLRRLAALDKVNALRERLEDSEEPTLVFCTFLEPLRQLHGRFPLDSVIMTGEDSIEDRQRSMELFQRGEKRIAFCSTMAMGHGVNLTRAEEVVFLDLPWTPAAKAQAEDRAHRIGQEASLSVVHMLAEGTIDEHVMAILSEKARIADMVLEGEVVSELARRAFQ